jgi:hypothetical protein
MRKLVVSVVILVASRAWAAKPSPIEYVDFLLGEATGELAGRSYDASAKVNDKSTFIGTQTLNGGVFLGGGLGLRTILRFDQGVRISVEGSAQWGHLNGQEGPFRSYSTVGYEGTVGKILTLHTCTVIGVDVQKLDVAGSPPALPLASLAQGGSAGSQAVAALTLPDGSGPQPSMKLEAVGLRLGQQVGLHIQLASIAALYADATFDYDGQWRVRAGLAIGRPGGAQPPGTTQRFGAQP